MPNWITITAAQLSDAKAAALVDALRTAALGVGQVDPVAEHIAAGVAIVRNAIASSGKLLVDADATTVPFSLKFLTLRCVLRSMQSRLNAIGALPLSEDERTEWDKDDAVIAQIAAGKLSVEKPDNPIATPTTQAKSNRPRITPRCERASRNYTA